MEKINEPVYFTADRFLPQVAEFYLGETILSEKRSSVHMRMILGIRRNFRMHVFHYGNYLPDNLKHHKHLKDPERNAELV